MGGRCGELLLLLLLVGVVCITVAAAAQKDAFLFGENFDIMWSENHFKTSPDGQIWYLSLDKETGKQMKLVGLFEFEWNS